MSRYKLISLTSPGAGRPKTILVYGKPVGSIRRVPKCSTRMAHWAGGLTNFKGEHWRVSENTLREVEGRVKEAFGWA